MWAWPRHGGHAAFARSAACAEASKICSVSNLLCARAQARRSKRRTVKFCDVEAAVRAERRWAEIGLRDLLREASFAELRDGAPKPRAGKENAAGGSPDPDPDPECADDEGPAAGSTRGKRPAAHKPGTPDKRARHITDFFHKG